MSVNSPLFLIRAKLNDYLVFWSIFINVNAWSIRDDPEGTLKIPTECREVFSDKIQEYKRRVVNAPGDSILAEFVVAMMDLLVC